MVLNEAEGVQYELFDINDLHELATMTADIFARDEPVTSSLGISSADFTDFVRLLGPKLKQEELTVIARNQESQTTCLTSEALRRHVFRDALFVLVFRNSPHTLRLRFSARHSSNSSSFTEIQ